MIENFENEVRHVGNRGRSAAKIVWILGFAAILSGGFSIKVASAQVSATAPGACCVNIGQLQTCEVAVRNGQTISCNGVVSTLPFGGSCSVRACTLPNGSCVDVDWMCRCPSLGGTPQMPGSVCPPPPVPTEACCGLNAPAESGSCVPRTPQACRDAGGEPAGVGTDCSISGTPPFEFDVCSVLRACCGSTVEPCGNYNLFMCVNDGGTPQSIGTNCSGDADGDLIANVCDNCPYDANFGQENSDTDGVGDVCDNCPLNNNDSQADADADGVGDHCDNCINTSNGGGGFCVVGLSPASCSTDADCDDAQNDTVGTCARLSGTCTAGDLTVASCKSHADCDTCPGLHDGICSTSQENCDGDNVGDACDGDIDGDGVNNVDDLCDFSPVGANVQTAVDSPFRGTMRADLDGDCDVDEHDHILLHRDDTATQTCIPNNSDVESPLCGAIITCSPPPPPPNTGTGCPGGCDTSTQPPQSSFQQ